MNLPPRIGGRIPAILHRFQSLKLIHQFLLLMAVCLPLTWGFIGYELRYLQETAEFETQRDIDNLSRAFAEEINSSANTIDLSLIVMRSHWMRNRQDFREIVTDLQKELQDKIIFQVAITDAQGIMLFSSADPQATRLDLSDREHIRVHLESRGTREDKLFISKPVLGRVSNKWSVQFTRPIYTADGKFDGVVVASVSPAYFSRFYRGIDLGKGGVVGVVLSDGTVLARSSDEQEGKGMGTILTGAPFDGKADAPSGFYRRQSRIDGMERFFGWRTLPRYGLIVIVGKSVSEAYARFASQQSVYIQGGIMVSLVIAFLGWILLRFSQNRLRMLEALTEAEARWKFALEGSGDGVWDWNLVTRKAALSVKAKAILQVESDAIDCSSQALRERIHPDDLPMVDTGLRAHFDGVASTFVVEFRVRARSGDWIWVLSRGMLVQRSPDGKPLRMVGTVSDIDERKEREEITKYLAQHDSLTRLPNRSLFTDRLHQSILQAQYENNRLAVIYFDLDKFKPVNDTYGHALGDSLLQAVAERVRHCLRASDTVARVGGDEFVVLLPRIAGADDAIMVANNILAALNTPFEVDGHRLDISGSIGIATYPNDGQDEMQLMRCADRAMYQAKNAGRNQVKIYQQEQDSGAKTGLVSA